MDKFGRKKVISFKIIGFFATVILLTILGFIQTVP